MNASMKIVTVIPLKKGTWKENLTYFTSQEISNGGIVSIPLRSKKILGLVISSEDARAAKSNVKGMSFNLKKVSEVKEHSIFRKEYFDAALATGRYYAASKNNAITSLIPAVLRENYDAIAKFSVPLKIPLSVKNELVAEKLLLQASLSDRLSYYKTLIRTSFAEKKSVFIVLPTEYDIKTFEESLSKGIERFTFVFHAGLSKKKILKNVEQVATLPHPVLMIGTAPFLSIPRPDMKIIVVEREASGAYKMIGRPHFDLRFFAELFAAKTGAKLILGDTLLRYETIARKETDNLIPVHPMQYRINFPGSIEIPEKTSPEETDKSKFRILADESIEEIKNGVNKKKNVFIFTLRKGLATMTVCRDCREMFACEKCGAPLVLYSSHNGQKRMFVCNRCEREKDGDQSCGKCGGWNLMLLGIGTDTVYEETRKLFPKTKIFKLDKESAKTKKGALGVIKEFEENPGSILIGTEMSFFYMRNKVPVSIIASFDSLWSLPSFRMGEKIIQIILSIIGNTTDKLIIQTKNVRDRALISVKTENLLSFVREELEDRQNLNYPPFKRFIKITFQGDKEQTLKARRMLEESFVGYFPEIFSGFIAQQKGKYVTNALIKIDPKKWCLPEISGGSSINEDLLNKLISLQPTFDVFVDPEDLL